MQKGCNFSQPFCKFELVTTQIMDTNIGAIFGNLTITSLPFRKLPLPTSKQLKTYVKATCSCGSGERDYHFFKLKAGEVKSCGCWLKQHPTQLTHGLTNHPIYRLWAGMKSRCDNPNNKKYHRYGKRGIKVCVEWQDPEVFYKWAIEHGWKKGVRIERNDNDLGYNPDNCTGFLNQRKSSQHRTNTFTLEEVYEIKRLFKDGMTRQQLADKYKRARSTITHLLNGRNWKDENEPEKITT